MKKILLLIVSCLSIVACSSDSDSDNNPAVSIDNNNANTFAKLGFQQFIALHSNQMLVRNTLINQPLFTNPCNSGSYSFTFTDTNNDGAFQKDDTVVETFTNCALNAGEITVSGSSTSTVTDVVRNGNFSMNVTHSNLRVTINGKTYTYNGLIQVVGNTDTVVTNMTNNYRDYSLSFGGNNLVISAGRTVSNYNFNQRSYSINQGVVLSGNSFTGQLRTDTTTAVIGVMTPSGKPLFSGNPLLDPVAEDEAIENESDATQKQALRDARAAFRAFTGRLRTESVTNNQFVEINSEDSDGDITTYLRNVRANSVTTPTTGLKWVDLLS